ncbi:MAG: CHAT domain-containing tetratricopeptide repeat protein [Bacteroidota bacterium]
MKASEELWQAGERIEALDQIEEAVAIYQQAEYWLVYLQAANQYAMGSVYGLFTDQGLAFCAKVDSSFLIQQGVPIPEMADYYMSLAYLLELDQDFEAADRVYQQALIGYRPLAQEDSLLFLGKVANYHQVRGVTCFNIRDDLPNAVQFGRVNFRLRMAHFPGTQDAADAMSDMAFLYDFSGKNDSTIWAYEQAAQMYRSLEKVPMLDLGLVLHNLSYAYGRIGNLEEQWKTAQAALRTWQQADTTNLLAQSDYLPKAYQHLGIIARGFGDYETDLDYNLKGLALLQKYGPPNPSSIGVAFLKVGKAYAANKNWEQALHYFDLAKAEFQQMEAKGKWLLANQQSSRAAVHRESGNYAKAIALYEEVRDAYESLPDEGAAVGAIINLSSVYRKMEDWPKVTEYLNIALDAHERTQHPYLKMVLAGLGHGYGRAGKAAASIEAHQQSLRLLSGETDLSLTDPFANPKAESFFHNAESLDLISGKANSLLRLAQQGGDSFLAPAWETYALAREVLESIQQRAQSTREVMTEQALALFEGALQCAYLQSLQQPDENWYQEMFVLMEQNKAASLRKNLQRSRANLQGGIPPALQVKERSLSASIDFFEEKWQTAQLIPAEKRDSLKLAYWQQKLISLRDEQRILVQELEEEYPGYFQVKYQTLLPSLAEVEGKLTREQEQLISYFLGDSTLLVFFTDGNQRKVGLHTVDETWKGAFSAFTQLIQAPSADMDSFARQSFHWYQQLVGPVHAQLSPERTLVLIPDGVLGTLPFESLLTEPPGMSPASPGNYRYLITQMPIRYAFSASWQQQLSSSSLREKPSMLAMAPSYSGTKNPLLATRGIPLHLRGPYQTLAFNQQEIEAISERWISAAEVRLGGRATEAQFKAQAQTHPFLHLAMHAYLDDRDPMYSALVFAEADSLSQLAEIQVDSLREDGYLHAFEIFNLSLPAQLVVLSACETGTGKVESGEGVMSLAQAFAYAGAQNVISSLWQVDDAATSFLMESFYQHLSEGHSQTKALQLARLEYLEKYPQSPPRFWSAWVLFGEGKAVESSSPSRLTLPLMLGTLFLLMAIGWFRRKKPKNSHKKG